VRLRIALVTAVAGLAAAGVATAGSSALPKLNATVGPDFTITLKKPGAGQSLKTIKAGKYSFVTKDKSGIHNFVLEKVKGGKFEKEITGVGFVGSKTVTINLTKGRYKYFCTPHESTMFGFFVVT